MAREPKPKSSADAGRQAPARKRPNSAPVAASADAWRHSNIGRLLNNCVRRFEHRVLELLAEAGHREIRLSQINLTRNLDVGGARVTELARAAAMTKQAMSELVAQCESDGLVTRVVDRSDSRAKIVKFTRRGLSWLAAFKTAVERAEQEMRQELGAARADALGQALRDYGGDFDPLER